MAKKCALSGKTAMAGRNTRHVHSGQWAHRAPKTRRTFQVNLQTVRVPVAGGGTQKIQVAARMLTSKRFLAILAGQAGKGTKITHPLPLSRKRKRGV